MYKYSFVCNIKVTESFYFSVGSRNSGPPSFANVISREKSVENLDTRKINETGKKGKKHSHVLLSTSGARRY